MKRFLFLFLMVALVVFGQMNLQSFRRQATYVLYDDLDNALMPEAIFGIEGWRIYTNLSNLSSGTEQLMNNTTDNTYVFGVVTPELIPGMKMALVYGNTRAETSILFSNEENVFQDIDLDGDFDLRERLYTLGNSDIINKMDQVLLLISKDLGGGIVSFGWNRPCMDNYSVSKDSTKVERYDLPAEEQSFDSLAWNTEITEEASIFNNFNLTYTLKDMNGYNVGIGLGIGFEKMVNSAFEDGYRFYDGEFGSSTLFDNRTDSTRSRYESSIPVLDMNMGVHAYKEDEGNVTEYSLGFGYGTGSTGYEYSEWGWMRTQETNNIGNVEDYTSEEVVADTGSLSYKRFSLFAGGRWVRRLNETLFFGMGLNFSYRSISNGYAGRVGLLEHESFNDGDNEPNDNDDYTSQVSSWYSYNVDDTQKDVEITAPVGVELAVTKNRNWFIRFGAEVSKSFTSSMLEFNPTEYQYPIGIVQYGDGTADTTIVDDYSIEGWRTSNYGEVTITNFAYGLGWHPNENISIDFIYMFAPGGTILDLPSIKALRLSATIKIR